MLVRASVLRHFGGVQGHNTNTAPSGGGICITYQREAAPPWRSSVPASRSLCSLFAESAAGQSCTSIAASAGTANTHHYVEFTATTTQTNCAPGERTTRTEGWIEGSGLGRRLKTGHSPTPQNRPFPALRSRPMEFYFVASSVRKSVWTLVRQLRGPHLSTCA